MKRMERKPESIKLKVKAGAWFGFYIFFCVFSSSLLFLIVETDNYPILIAAALAASFLVTGIAAGIFYFYQSEVILNEREIRKSSYPSKTIAYSDIRKIKVGAGGFSIYDKGKNPINITTMYSNFDEAKSLLNQKIGEREEISIKGSKTFIKKYLDQSQKNE
jgi:hypothetical protein